MSRDFLLKVFSWIIFPQPLKLMIGSFLILSKIRGDICKSKSTTSLNDTGGKFAMDTGGKVAIWNWYRLQICHWCQQHRGNLPPVSMTLVVNLPPVSMKPVANNGKNIRLRKSESELEKTFLIGVFYHLSPFDNLKSKISCLCPLSGGGL